MLFPSPDNSKLISVWHLDLPSSMATFYSTGKQSASEAKTYLKKLILKENTDFYFITNFIKTSDLV
jgi:hypothetical protein